MFNSYTKNTLEYYPEKCIGCGLCANVCPHAVFTMGERASAALLTSKKVAVLSRKVACMECGACQLNCPVDAIKVQSGVGCAAAMIRAALTGGPETCGDGGCCGTQGSSSTETCSCSSEPKHD